MKILTESHSATVQVGSERFTRRATSGMSPMWIDEQTRRRIRDREIIVNLEETFAQRNLPTEAQVLEARANKKHPDAMRMFLLGASWMLSHIANSDDMSPQTKGIALEDPNKLIR